MEKSVTLLSTNMDGLNVYFIGFFVSLIISSLFRKKIGINGDGCVCFALLWPLCVALFPFYIIIKILGSLIDRLFIKS